eukprot:GGOE01014026.1.p1 GENE.GGOE01014026.1~~GGOE01014026.1.p1  ORF type:complete len:2057 (-),score=451.46 GGOE01014026.1:451-6585(-)
MTQPWAKPPPKIGLYDPQCERDACGVGFIVNIKGIPCRKVMDDASQSVDRMVHRGALGADPLTGDGAGIMTALPHPLFQKVAQENNWDLPAPGEYAVGNFFLSLNDVSLNHATKEQVEAIAAQFGVHVFGWRRVPTDNTHIGSGAKATEPSIEQAFVRQAEGTEGAERYQMLSFRQKLFLFRKQCEVRITEDENFYVCSLSPDVIVYKGQLTPEQVFLYFAADLHHPLYKTHVALVHTRFSTNTFPSWNRAQPLRVLAHNGEINTLRGNKNWMRSREGLMKSEAFGKNLEKLYPIIDDNGSDSAALDNVVEFLLMDGSRQLPEIMMTLVPEAWENHTLMSEEKKGFYQWASLLMEAWDGPGLFVFSNSRYVGAVLDRNGLRPARFYVTTDDIMIMASEVGVVDLPPHMVKQKGRLMPGRMLLVDTEKGIFYNDADLKQEICSARPYGQWVKENLITLDAIRSKIQQPATPARPSDIGEGFDPRLAAFNYTREHVQKLLIPMVTTQKEALGSMGNDAALACMSLGPRLPYDYFKQLFAQVTNPPIDPFREAVVMSLRAAIGPQGNLLQHTAEQCHRISLDNPVLRIDDLERLKTMAAVPGWESWKVAVADTTFPKEEGPLGLKNTLHRICKEAMELVNSGVKLIVLSDRAVGPTRVPISGLLAVGAVHQHLVSAKKRLQVGLIVETGDAREVHHLCALVGFGADAICPYMVYETMFYLRDQKEIFEKEAADDMKIMNNYLKAVDMGMRKVMAKMGISTLLSYKAAQIFEAVGVGKEVVDMCFTRVASRLGGADFHVFGTEALMCHELAWPTRTGVIAQPVLQDHGEYHYRTGGAEHINDPVSIANLQDAARNKNKAAFANFVKAHDEQVRRCCLRGLLDFKQIDRAMHVPLDEVEPAANIVKRFVTGAMSYGSISGEAHRTLAVAMNRIGGKSNTGEGGEETDRWQPKDNGDSEKSAIKQVASGRFGVTIGYLGSAIEIQIKMAQGAKPGEGGELPGHKVSKGIAATRHSTPGVGLISPPPHHDIYSIEDLAQLIYDLKCANPEARISVKLVSEVGVGVIAAGVTKGHADHITISGHDGGTGASSWTGVKHAGLPWELGIAETHQTLVLNNLRGRVVLQTDGQLRTGRDVIVASMLGADEFGFSTAPLIVMGCTMMRKCHLNTCPVGIATQDPVLRKKFDGAPEHVVNYFFMLAQEIRQYMSKLGFRTMEEMTGRSDMLVVHDAIKSHKSKLLDLSDMLMPAFHLRMGVPTTPCQKQDHGLHLRVDNQVITRVRHTIKDPAMPSHFEMSIHNRDRDFATTLSYEVNKYTKAKGLPDDSIHIKLYGSAGQSLGAYLCKGITIELVGDSNDYVGKGLSGGKIYVYPAEYHCSFVPSENVIVGNVCLYGATSGEAFFCGHAAERFCVRNSGATAVVEGVGDHGCEYMTGGRCIVLGPTGRNFAAGMSGGIAYVHDQDGDFASKCNLEMVGLVPVVEPMEVEWLKGIVAKHRALTGSAKAQDLLDHWATALPKFVKVFPHDYRRVLEEEAAEQVRREQALKAKIIRKVEPKPMVKDIEDIGALNKVQGFMKYARKADPYTPIPERVKNFEELTHRHTPDHLKIQAARCMDCGVPFCQTTATGCPLGNIIPTWNDLVFNGKHKEALYTLLSTNSFPEFTGRVCPAPCEGACVLGINADPVSIKSIECAIIDKAFEEGWMKPKTPQRTGKTVCIVGSGPAGLAAAHQLNNAGHKVTVFERAPQFGGLLQYGIPNMKLDKKVVARRIQLMRDEGVEFVANANVGVDIDPQELLEKNDALILANGATWPRNLPIKGRDLPGIHFAMDFLGANPNKVNAAGCNVLVIGGGDTGNDCIGTSLRQGAKSIVSFEIMPQPPNGRAKDNPWPQWPRIFRVDYGHAEVKEMMGQDPRNFGILTKEFIGNEKGVAGCKTVQVEWTKDATGRVAMKEVPGTEKVWECDLVFLAMGFLGPETTLTDTLKLDIDARSNYKTPPGQYCTSVPRVYAAGDCRRGQSLVVWAINEGRQVAREVDADLMGTNYTPLAVTGGIVKIHA